MKERSALVRTDSAAAFIRAMRRMGRRTPRLRSSEELIEQGRRIGSHGTPARMSNRFAAHRRRTSE